MTNIKSQKKLKITMDSGVDLKRLKILEKDGLVEIHDVKGENFARSVRCRESAVFILDHSTLDGEDVLTDNSERYEKIIQIIGRGNFQDARKLDAHIREEFDYFVTNNPRDFIYNNKREKLQNSFSELKIVTIDELEDICQK